MVMTTLTARDNRRSRRRPFCCWCCRKQTLNNKVRSHKLRRSYAANLFNAGVEQVVIKVLFGHERSATAPIYAHVGQEHME